MVDTDAKRIHAFSPGFNTDIYHYTLKGVMDYSYLYDRPYEGLVVDEFIALLNFTGSTAVPYGTFLGDLTGFRVDAMVTVNNLTAVLQGSTSPYVVCAPHAALTARPVATRLFLAQSTEVDVHADFERVQECVAIPHEERDRGPRDIRGPVHHQDVPHLCGTCRL